ncbi:MAG TPA: hypothetical protein VF386_07670, partial [Usitatibacter sp.]
MDEAGRAAALVARAQLTGADGAVSESHVTLPARTVLIAAGTQPNTVLAREDPEHFVLDGRYFRAVDDDGNPVKPERSAKPAQAQVLMARMPDGRCMSFFGDLHPSFFGNVVKAMGSAKQGFPVVSRVLAKLPPRKDTDARAFLAALNERLRATVHRVERLTPKIVEVSRMTSWTVAVKSSSSFAKSARRRSSRADCGSSPSLAMSLAKSF